MHKDETPLPAVHWRERASLTRDRASEAQSPAERARLAKIAAEYDRLADIAAARTPQDTLRRPPPEDGTA